MNKRIAVITGATGGIGSHLAASYAENSYKVVMSDLEAEKGDAVCHAILNRHPDAEVIFVPADLKKPEDIVRLMEQSRSRFGGVDVLINNAGFGIGKSPYELEVDEWDSVLFTNLRGTFLCAREAAKLMRQQPGGGRIVNIASTRAMMSEPNTEAYAASKGGITALTHALAASLGPDGITVNCISPGWIELGDYSALREIDHKQHLSGRVGKPADIARACLYLTEPENDFVTGINLVVDGGMTRKMIYEE
jgi:NAD(P)-dependent dehydrogenase (short-subunit alcohol dehydrogenase family)